MPSFTDNQNQKWTVDIEPNIVKVVRSELDYDMFGHDFQARLADPVLMVDALYLLCREQANSLGVDDQQFGRRCVGKIDEIMKAIVEAMADFFGGQRGKHLMRIAAAQDRLIGLELEKAKSELQLQMQLAESQLSKSGNSSGRSPATRGSNRVAKNFES